MENRGEFQNGFQGEIYGKGSLDKENKNLIEFHAVTKNPVEFNSFTKYEEYFVNYKREKPLFISEIKLFLFIFNGICKIWSWCRSSL
jgi:hypothetical protein